MSGFCTVHAPADNLHCLAPSSIRSLDGPFYWKNFVSEIAVSIDWDGKQFGREHLYYSDKKASASAKIWGQGIHALILPSGSEWREVNRLTVEPRLRVSPRPHAQLNVGKIQRLECVKALGKPVKPNANSFQKQWVCWQLELRQKQLWSDFVVSAQAFRPKESAPNLSAQTTYEELTCEPSHGREVNGVHARLGMTGPGSPSFYFFISSANARRNLVPDAHQRGEPFGEVLVQLGAWNRICDKRNLLSGRKVTGKQGASVITASQGLNAGIVRGQRGDGAVNLLPNSKQNRVWVVNVRRHFDGPESFRLPRLKIKSVVRKEPGNAIVGGQARSKPPVLIGSECQRQIVADAFVVLATQQSNHGRCRDFLVWLVNKPHRRSCVRVDVLLGYKEKGASEKLDNRFGRAIRNSERCRNNPAIVDVHGVPNQVSDDDAFRDNRNSRNVLINPYRRPSIYRERARGRIWLKADCKSVEQSRHGFTLFRENRPVTILFERPPERAIVATLLPFEAQPREQPSDHSRIATQAEADCKHAGSREVSA